LSSLERDSAFDSYFLASFLSWKNITAKIAAAAARTVMMIVIAVIISCVFLLVYIP